MKLALLLFTTCMALPGGAPQRRVETVTTESAEVAPNGSIRFEGSTGDLNIEGWDQPRVEITITRYAFRPDDPKARERAQKELEAIRIVKRANGELTISTSHPHFLHGHVEYRAMIPRMARLTIRHGTGAVVIHDFAGDLDATVKKGDIALQLSGPARYTFDARCRAGGVYSDFGDDTSPAGHSSSARLRVGLGGIEIQRIAPGI